MTGRIYKAKLYIVAIPQGISGFPKPSLPAIVTGARLKRDLLKPWTGGRVCTKADKAERDWRISQ